jgi:HSP20 family protein
MIHIQEEMNRLFNNMLSRSPERGSDEQCVWSPFVDISETIDEIIIQAEIPGIAKDDVNITIQDNVLSLSGDRKQESTEENRKFLRVERVYGSFRRTFTLPAMVEADKVTARYRDGILTIHLPKAEEAKAREVAIDVK